MQREWGADVSASSRLCCVHIRRTREKWPLGPRQASRSPRAALSGHVAGAEHHQVL